MADSLESWRQSIERFILDPKNHDFLVLVKALRNGLVYGTKIRFPHALVMTFLFKSGSLSERIRAIYRMTRKHALNLATFACCYKMVVLSLKRMPNRALRAPPLSGPAPAMPHKHEASSDSFIAGIIAGYLVFGRKEASRSSVTQQIVIYVFARVCLALAKLAIQPAIRPDRPGFQAGYSPVATTGLGLLERLPLLGSAFQGDNGELWRRRFQENSWPVFASVSWGLVMWLFRWYPELVQPSMRSSMKYLYDDSEHWASLKTFLWHNK